MPFIDLRSDTVTLPTEEMRRAILEADLGDDVYGEDPTVNRLERKAAELLGKEAGLFVPTGTMGNQVCVMTHTRPGDELIAPSACHIVRYEGGGAARLSGVSCALVEGSTLDPEDIRRLVRPLGNVHFPHSRLVCLENAVSNGDLLPLPRMRELYHTAKEYGLMVHLDGARLFNAAVALEVPARELAACADSLNFCLSKGLAAPAGSMVCGSAEFIERARYARKVLGGGMRQAGVLAACGLVALDHMIDRLAEDHRNARRLGERMSEIPGLKVDFEHLKTNMVFWSCSRPGFDDQALVSFMAARQIKLSPFGFGRGRLVTHKDVSAADVETFIAAFKEYLDAL